MKKHLFFHLAAVSVLSMSAQVSPDGTTYQPQTIGDAQYSLSCKWFNPGLPFPISHVAANSVSHFFIYDGDMYFNETDNDSGNKIYCIDGETGLFNPDLHIFEINWKRSQPAGQALGFAGNDSKGNPFIISRSIGSESGYPLTVYTLKFEDGEILEDKSYNIPFYAGEFGSHAELSNREARINGDLSTGNFIIATPIWNKVAPTTQDNVRTYVGIWEFQNGSAVDMNKTQINLSLADVHPIDLSTFAVTDRNGFHEGNPPTGSSFIDPRPSIYTITGETATLKSAFPCDEENHSGNGMAIFTLGDNTFMVYAATDKPAYRIARLNDYPASMQGEVLWNLAPDKDWTNSESLRLNQLRTVVGVEKPNDYTANIYMFSNQRGVAAYTLSLPDPTQTSLSNISADDDSPVEYFNLQGFRISRPTTYGLYIVRKGDKTAKQYIQR